MDKVRSETQSEHTPVSGALPTDLLEPPGRCSGWWSHDSEIDGGAVG